MVEVFLNYRLASMGREGQSGSVSLLLDCIDVKTVSKWKCFLMRLHKMWIVTKGCDSQLLTCIEVETV